MTGTYVDIVSNGMTSKMIKSNAFTDRRLSQNMFGRVMKIDV